MIEKLYNPLKTFTAGDTKRLDRARPFDSTVWILKTRSNDTCLQKHHSRTRRRPARAHRRQRPGLDLTAFNDFPILRDTETPHGRRRDRERAHRQKRSGVATGCRAISYQFSGGADSDHDLWNTGALDGARLVPGGAFPRQTADVPELVKANGEVVGARPGAR